MTVEIKVVEEILMVIIAYGENEDVKKQERNNFFGQLQKGVDKREGNNINGRSKRTDKKSTFRYRSNTGKRRNKKKIIIKELVRN